MRQSGRAAGRSARAADGDARALERASRRSPSASGTERILAVAGVGNPWRALTRVVMASVTSAALALTIACTDSKMQQTTFTTELAGCRLTLRVAERTTDVLRLQYTFENNGTRNAYFFEEIELARRDGILQASREHPLFVALDGTHILLSKKVLAIPPSGGWPETPAGPYATRVAPGASATRVVELRLPIPYYHPHQSTAEYERQPGVHRGGRATHITNLEAHFELGFEFLEPYSDVFLDEHHRVQVANGQVYYDWELSHAERQMLMRVGPVAEIPVLAGVPLLP
ncbi:MAG: hypothetical protein IT373_38480 [Polyangiaceae bacterium]|nr:hypothetical protein [Polyangiaceae bacterium]